MSAGPTWMTVPTIGQARPATASPPQTPPAVPESNANNFAANSYLANSSSAAGRQNGDNPRAELDDGAVGDQGTCSEWAAQERVYGWE